MTGAGAVVAVVDSGAALSHPDLRGQLVAGRDVVDGDATPSDGAGHGTHVTGIVAAATGNGVGVASVAPGARVIPVRVRGPVPRVRVRLPGETRARVRRVRIVRP